MTHTHYSPSDTKETGRGQPRRVIRVRGCDDTTDIASDVFSDAELDVIRKLAALTLQLGGGCAPTVHIGHLTEVTMTRRDGYSYTWDDFDFQDEQDPS